MTDIFKSADWAREAEAKKRVLDWYTTELPVPDGATIMTTQSTPIYMDANGDLWTITMHGNDRVKLFGGPAGGSMKDGSE